MFRHMMRGLMIAACCGLLWPASSDALDSRVRYRLKSIQRSIQYAQRQLKQGKPQYAQRTVKSIDRKWKTLWRYYGNRISMGDPEIAQADKQIKSLKQQISAANKAPAAAPTSPTPPADAHRGPTGHRSARRHRAARGRTFFPGAVNRFRRAGGGSDADVTRCYSKAVMDACSKLATRIYKTCKFDYGSMYADWHKRLSRMPAVNRAIEAFMAKNQSCTKFKRSRRVRVNGRSKLLRRWDNVCSVPNDRNKCTSNIERSKAYWKKTVARLAKSGNNKELRQAIQYNRNPALNIDVSALQSRLSSRIKGAARARARGRAKLAAVRCPRARYANGALHRAVRRAVMGTQDKPGCRGKSSPKRCWRHSLWVSSYHLMSRPTQPRYHTWRRFYSQFVKVDTCVRRTVKGRTYCRVYHHRLKRIKPLNGRWGPWRPRSFSYTNMLCKHLR